MDHAPFPSLRIGRAGVTPQGAYAEAQARYLRPDPARVAALDAAMRAANAGVVAHFYMDPELQGALAACTWPHIHVSDSLVMADRAVAMAEAGVDRVVVLGVDFMSENVRAMLDAAGHQAVEVYRVAAAPIGCSLAEAAEGDAYHAFLLEAADTPGAVHVVYINTSLRTKAQAEALVPTITVTSSNVVRTILHVFAELPAATVFFGPDTYMGDNVRTLLARAAGLGDAACRALHPGHDAASVRAALPRLRVFAQGACVVHHLFGAAVVEQVRRDYPDALLSAHLEVPGEMFALAAAAAAEGRGVVGSTSNILDFIAGHVRRRAAGDGDAATLQVVLGTEAGMITPIVREVQRLLADVAAPFEVEIVFPVAADAIAATDDPLGIVPGVLAGEGCSTAGGCATCPYMKMNTLDATLDVLRRSIAAPWQLEAFHPHSYNQPIAGRSVASLGGVPILAMRALGRDGRLPTTLLGRAQQSLAAAPRQG